VPGTPEEDYYRTCKANYRARNDSIVHDIFYGTFRTETKCPNCNHVSLKFEPFNMLSLPIPVTTKETTMVLTYYFINQYCLYDLIKVECSVGRDVSLKSIKDGYAASRQLDPSSVSFYSYHGKTFEWKENDNLEQSLGEVKFPEDSFFFLIEDNTAFTKQKDMVHVLYLVDDTKRDGVVGIRKLTKVPPQCSLKYLYQFFFECLKQVFGDALNSFDESFSSKNMDDRLFDLYYNGQPLKFYSEQNERARLEVKDYSEIVVKIHKDNIRNHKKLNSLETNHAEKYPDGNLTLKNCFEALTNPEKLDEENKWLCEKCKQHTRANFRLSIKELPPVLILHLKRFKKSANGAFSKITDAVDFPIEDLSIADFTTDPELPDNQCTYSLFGVVNHSGSVNFGHYTSIVSNRTKPGQWVECDDENTSTFESGPHFYKNRVYILFYKKNQPKTLGVKLASSYMVAE
jgi:rubrerythrin